MRYPKPSVKEMRTALRDHKVDFTEANNAAVNFRGGNPGSPWPLGLRAATVHHTAGVNSWGWILNSGGQFPFANCVVNNGKYNGADVDGRVQIAAWGSCWHSGWGGPWPGVAGEDSLHLVSFGIEIESRGVGPDITDAQQENVGRLLASFVDLGMPVKNVHRHADWTDATGPVTGPLRERAGYPNTTRGRKTDTRKEWYPTRLWMSAAQRYREPKVWDGAVPPYENIVQARLQPGTHPHAISRVQARLFDLGYRRTRPVAWTDDPMYPEKSIIRFQQATHGLKATGRYTKNTHNALFNVNIP